MLAEDASKCFAELPHDSPRQLLEATASVVRLTAERDEYKRLYMATLELCRKLELGIFGQSRERFIANDAQLSMELLAGLLAPVQGDASAPPPSDPVKAHERKKPTGRKPLPETLPRVNIEILPPEVLKAGLDAFNRIGEDVTETVERRPGSLVVVAVHKPKFIAKSRDPLIDDAHVLQAPPPELPIPAGLPGPALLADTVVKRWDDYLPLHRLERIYGREGLDLARSTICGWHQALAEFLSPLLDAMRKDTLCSPVLLTDATGVLVQAKQKCRHGHFWVLIAPGRHVLFRYSSTHDSGAVDSILAGYKGFLVADAHAVYDHLYETGDVIEVGCWSHCRRYWYKALASDPVRATHAITLIQRLFRIEREQATSTPERRRQIRQEQSRPLVDAFFKWCDEQAPRVLDETPISKAVNYARNHRLAFERFLEDGRLPLHNNLSEGALRREAIGRNNWTFLGNDEGGKVNATHVSLLASCHLHDIEPAGYLRDLYILLPDWNVQRVLELAPVNWKETLKKEETQQLLAANIFRQVSLGTLVEHPPSSSTDPPLHGNAIR